MDNNQLNWQSPQQHSQAIYLEDEIDLVGLFRILAKSSLIIFSFTFTCFGLATIYSFRTVDVFRAETVLIPIGSAGTGSSLGGQLGQAASFAGFNIGEENRQLDFAIAALRSRQVIGQFISENDLAVPLVAGIWNKDDQKSEIDPEIYDVTTGQWLGRYAPGGPTEWQLYNILSNVLTLTEDQQSTIIRLSIEWHDPILSSTWLNDLVDKVNNLVKVKDLSEAKRAIEFSQSQLQSTQLVEMQRIFYDIIEEQTKVLLLADVREEYVFQVVDRAVIAEEKIRPQRFIIIVGGILFGALLGVLFVLFRHYLHASLLKDKY